MFTFNTEIRKYNLQSKVKKVNFLQSHNSLEPSKDLEVLCWCYIVYHASMRKKFDYHFLFTFSVHLFKLLETFPSILIPDWLFIEFLAYVLFIIHSELYGVSSGLMYMSCVAMVLYTPLSMYRISYFISANLLIMIPILDDYPPFSLPIGSQHWFASSL